MKITRTSSGWAMHRYLFAFRARYDVLDCAGRMPVLLAVNLLLPHVLSFCLGTRLIIESRNTRSLLLVVGDSFQSPVVLSAVVSFFTQGLVVVKPGEILIHALGRHFHLKRWRVFVRGALVTRRSASIWLKSQGGTGC